MSVPRALATLVSAALLAAAVSAPATGADARASTAGPPLDGTSNGLPALSPAEADAIRDHAVRALEGRPGAVAAAVADDTFPVNPIVTRHSGSDRYATAASLATDIWGDILWADVDGTPYPFDKVVFVASGHDFADALSGGPLAALHGGPILLTRKDGLPGAARNALAALEPDHIVVLGGSGAVSDSVVWELAQFVPELQRVKRIGGKDRYDMSANLSRDIFINGFGERAYVALGTNWPDGLAGGAAAGWEGVPLLLTRKDNVPGVVLETLALFQPAEIVLLGGTAAVSDAVQEELEMIAPVVRVGGADRYAVAANAAYLHDTQHGATVASGQNWPDALAGSAYAGLVGDKVLLLRSSGVPTATRQAVLDQAAVFVEALGGTNVLPEAVLDELRAMTVQVPAGAQARLTG